MSEIDELGRRHAERVRGVLLDAQPPGLDQLTVPLHARPQRTLLSALATAMAVMAVVVAVAFLLPAPTSPEATGPALSGTTLSRPVGVGYDGVWGLAYPPAWHRAGSDLMPNLGFRSVTVASMALRPGGENCAQVPENALRDMSTDDVLLTVFFTGNLDPNAAAFPDTLDDSTFPEQSGTDAEDCAGRASLETHWGSFTVGEESIYALLVFGEDVDAANRQAAWDALASLQSRGEVSEGGGEVCVVTLPGVPVLTPREPYNATPSSEGHAWYGSPELWTILPVEEPYLPRKSVWWSANFPGGAVEESPNVDVVWRRLDADTPPIEGERSTNGFTPEDGSFMIVGFDPDLPGCWEVTGTYKGTTLSYVFETHS